MPAGVATPTPVACGTRQIMRWTTKAKLSRSTYSFSTGTILPTTIIKC